MESATEGVWIPLQIMRVEGLTWPERIVLATVSNMVSKGGECRASNRFFCELLDVDDRAVRRIIARLVTAGYLTSEVDNGRGRLLSPRSPLALATPDKSTRGIDGPGQIYPGSESPGDPGQIDPGTPDKSTPHKVYESKSKVIQELPSVADASEDEPPEPLPPPPEPDPEPDPPPKRRQDRPAMLAEVILLFRERGYIDADDEAEAFWNHYTANGWKVGRNPMKDWRAAAANWNMNRKNGTYGRAQTQSTRRPSSQNGSSGQQGGSTPRKGFSAGY